MPKYNNELSGNVNEREMRDLKKIERRWRTKVQIKEINSNWDKTHLGLSFGQFLGEQNVERGRRREKKRRRRERREESQERYGFLYTGMELANFVMDYWTFGLLYNIV